MEGVWIKLLNSISEPANQNNITVSLPFRKLTIGSNIWHVKELKAEGFLFLNGVLFNIAFGNFAQRTANLYKTLSRSSTNKVRNNLSEVRKIHFSSLKVKAVANCRESNVLKP